MKKVIVLSFVLVFGAIMNFANPKTTFNNDVMTTLRGSPPLAVATLNTPDVTAMSKIEVKNFISTLSTASPPATFNLVNTRNADANIAGLNIRPLISSFDATFTTMNLVKITATDASPPTAQNAQNLKATTGKKINITTADATKSPPTASIATTNSFANGNDAVYAIYITATDAGGRHEIVLLC